MGIARHGRRHTQVFAVDPLVRSFAEQLDLDADVAREVSALNAEVGVKWLLTFLSADQKEDVLPL